MILDFEKLNKLAGLELKSEEWSEFVSLAVSSLEIQLNRDIEIKEVLDIISMEIESTEISLKNIICETEKDFKKNFEIEIDEKAYTGEIKKINDFRISLLNLELGKNSIIEIKYKTGFKEIPKIIISYLEKEVVKLYKENTKFYKEIKSGGGDNDDDRIVKSEKIGDHSITYESGVVRKDTELINLIIKKYRIRCL